MNDDEKTAEIERLRAAIKARDEMDIALQFWDRELVMLRHLIVMRMGQFEELVDALRRCHATLLVTRFLNGNEHSEKLNEVIQQAERILFKVEAANGNEPK